MPLSTSKLRRSLERGGPLGIALALGAVLVASSGLSYRDARVAAGLVAERQGIALLRRLDAAIPPRTPEVAALQATLDALRPLGLRYLAVVSGGVIAVEAGQATLAGRPVSVGVPAFGSGVVRMIGRGPPPGPPPPPPGRFPPPPGLGPEPPPWMGPPPPPGPPSSADRPPHPFGLPPPRREIVIEFEPIGSEETVRRALAVLWLSSGAAVLLAAAAIGLWLKARRAERTEAQLEAQRHLAQLGEMSAVLAHEIRNPLAALKGHAQLLAEAAPDPQAAARAGRVVDAAVRLEQLTNGLLAFARSGAIHVAACSPAELLERAAQATDPSRVERQIEGAPPRFNLDATRIEQVLVNLIDNALAVTPFDGRVVATAGTGEDGALLLTVRDRGPGVPAAERTRIFEPFHTTKVRGTGLGLAVARRIVELHGGTIELDDAPGGGTVFRVSLPWRGAAA